MKSHKDQYWDQSFLFSYINDICNVSEMVKFILFADDTNVLYSDHDINNVHVCTTTSNELDKLHAWFTANKLSLTISKNKLYIIRKTYMYC